MAFSEKHNNWNSNKAKAIIDHYGYKFFFKKKILDLGSGHGEVAAALARLGADVLCADARQENLKFIQNNHSFLKVMLIDLDYQNLSFANQFDMVLSLGLLCHIKNYEKHIIDICNLAEHVVLETEVLDSTDTNAHTPIYEDKTIHELSFNGEGSIITATNIQNRLSELGATFKRIDDGKINSGSYRYDWKDSGTGRSFGNRRFWFIRRDKHFVQMQANNIQIKKAESKVAMPQPPAPQNTAQYVRQVPQPTRYNPTLHQPSPPTATIPIPVAPTTITSVPTSSRIRLFYNYYEDKNPLRKNEIDFCLQQNIKNPLFDTIVLDSDGLPTYDFFFERINKLTGPNDINIICNSDIFFDETIGLVKNIGLNTLYALSRWEWHNGTSKLRELRNSQDVWIFRGPVENVDGSFQLGKPFCDNRIAFEFNRAGYKVVNPSRSIKSYHFHSSGIRSYNGTEKVEGNYLFVDLSYI